MNQILVTKKLYVTPELKRKKKVYKFNFVFSIFLIVALISVYIYAEYDRNKSEEVSQDILAEMTQVAENKDNTIIKDSNVLVVVLDDSKQSHEHVEEVVEEIKQDEQQPTYANVDTSYSKKTSDGYKYRSLASISIPKIGVNYPILEGETMGVEETDSLLRISPCKFWGGNINEVGNYCIIGHNYRNNRFFSKVPTLGVGDTFTISELSGRELTYQIYDKYTVEPQNVSCTSQLTNGKKEVTLITCTNDSQYRVIIKAKELK